MEIQNFTEGQLFGIEYRVGKVLQTNIFLRSYNNKKD